ncbi:MAG: putative metalloprotease CJM1_0395 family protein [Pseudomonadota bacterium]
MVFNDNAPYQAARPALAVTLQVETSPETRSEDRTTRVAAPLDRQFGPAFDDSQQQALTLRANLAAESAAASNEPAAANGRASGASETQSGELSAEKQAVVDALVARDREVRNHEEAHARVGGAYAGEPSYTFQQGPDGKQYAVGGAVAIDVSPIEGDPEATISKMEVVKAAALAPAEPSGQDRRVAAVAEANRQQAIADLAALRREIGPSPQPDFDRAA